ncbi:pentatricopeptide repeat-containing protein [Striga asiatica]|uniref:Pentatricopeptide repeat-containing protein n=1 Tax=Striga asiatica TaxID=4170 RepID=A0A5A7PWN1_STRAF|nr:pentatricopeptide repeat-containing protein [Striga asiatica]
MTPSQRPDVGDFRRRLREFSAEATAVGGRKKKESATVAQIAAAVSSIGRCFTAMRGREAIPSNDPVRQLMSGDQLTICYSQHYLLLWGFGIIASRATTARCGHLVAFPLPLSVQAQIGAASGEKAPATMMRFTVRLKCLTNSLRDWKDTDFGRKNAAAVTEAFRPFATSCGKPFSRSMQEEIVNALHSGDRSRASCLLSELSNRSLPLQARDFVSILQYCAKAPDPLFVMETWKVMLEKDVELSGNCYFLTIRSLCRGGHLKEAFQILRIQRENSNIYPSLPVYNVLLEACVQSNSLDHATECLTMMEQQGIHKNDYTYNFLLKLAVLREDLAAVHEIWKEYISCHIPSIITVQKFIWSFTMLKDLQSACAALQQMIAVALQQKDSIIETPKRMLLDSTSEIPIPLSDDSAQNKCEENNYPSVLSSSECYKERDSNEALKFDSVERGVSAGTNSLSGQPFSEPVMKLLGRSVGDIIQSCAKSKNVLLAKHLMLQMQNLGLEPSSWVYDGYVRSLVPVKDFHEAMDVLEVMQQKRMKPLDSTLAAISVSCSKGLELDLAETMLAQMSKCHYAYPFNAFLEACNTLGQPVRALRILAKMKDLKITPDIRTYELLFSLFGNVNAPYEVGDLLSHNDVAKRIMAIEMDMSKHGIHHSRTSIYNLLKVLGREGMIKEMIHYLGVAENQFLQRGSHIGARTYNMVLHSLVEAKESHIAIEIFKGMISCGLSPNATTYNIMIDCCSIIKCYRSACAIISMIIRRGFSPNSVTCTPLIKGRIDVIELIVEQMYRQKIKPDPSTCSHVFTAYVESGFHSTAMEALQVLSMRMISHDENILDEKKLEYENLIFGEDPETESRIIEVFKDSPSTGVALLYLRWSATLELSISWSPSESPWAKRLSSDYASRHSG